MCHFPSNVVKYRDSERCGLARYGTACYAEALMARSMAYEDRGVAVACREGKGFGRCISVSLSVLLAMTLAWSLSGEGFSRAAAAIAGDAIPMASSANSALEDDNFDGRSATVEVETKGGGSSDDVLVAALPEGSPQDEGDHIAMEAEAQLAEIERASDPSDLGYVPGEVVVVYEEGASASEREAALEDVEGVQLSDEAKFESGDAVSVEISEDLTVETAAEIVAEDPAVKYAIPNYYVSILDEPAASTRGASLFKMDDYQTTQWYLDYVKAPAAWGMIAYKGGDLKPAKVAVIDTGASLSHPDLANVVNRVQSIEVCYDGETESASRYGQPLRGDGYVNGSALPEEFSSHGTHVSGIIAAEAGNGGLLGVASGGATDCANGLVDLVVIDAFSQKTRDRNNNWVPGGTLQDVLFAMGYARDAGCSIINMSLGFDSSDEKLVAYFNEICNELASKNDMLIVAAAGNEGLEKKTVPAACDNVLGVISLTHRQHPSPSGWKSVDKASWCTNDVVRSSFSNYGSWCDLCAPGEAIYSSLFVNGKTNDYGYMDGTSMACPIVTAIASMVRVANPDLTAGEVSGILCETATDLSPVAGRDNQSGFGAVDAEAAVSRALSLIDDSWDDASAATAPGGERPDEQTSDEHSSLSQQKPLSEVSVSLSSARFTYNGADQRPLVSLRYRGEALIEGRDYALTWSSAFAVNAGSYGVTVSGCGSYAGDVTKTFLIEPANVASAQVSVASQLYTGAPLTPAPVVTMLGRELARGRDYAVYYENNIKVGTATTIISGMGNYTGSKNVRFSITSSHAVVSAQAERKMPSLSQSVVKAGWKAVGKKWRYLNSNGSYAKGWQKIGGTWYYFHGTGDMAKGWTKVDGAWYYLKGSGAMITGWCKVGGSWYYLKPSGVMATGWYRVGRSWYYSNASGAMQSGKWVGSYYLTGSGAMATNRWIGRYHVDASGKWDRTR